MRITRHPRPPYSVRTTAVIWGATGVLFMVMHLAVWSVTSSLLVRLIFNLIAIAVMLAVTVNAFRTFLRADRKRLG